MTTTQIQIPYLNLIEEPTTEPLTLSEVKLALKIDNGDDDSYLINLIRAARTAAEEYLHRSLITQTWQLQYDQYAPSTVNLPRGPVQNIVSVKIIDNNWEQSLVSITSYHLNAGKECLVFDVVPMGMVVQIRYAAGYGSLEEVPCQLKQGMLQHITSMYDDRVMGGLMPESVKALYSPHKIFKV